MGAGGLIGGFSRAVTFKADLILVFEHPQEREGVGRRLYGTVECVAAITGKPDQRRIAER